MMKTTTLKDLKGKKLLLIDGHALFYRSYYAIRGLTTKDGHPTNAIFGFLRGLFKAITDESPDYVAVVFDGAEETFRDEISTDYKAHRDPMPDDLFVQLEPLHEILGAMGIPLFIEEGYEADDVIATLVDRACEAAMAVVILSGDKDLFALVGECVTVLAPGRGVDEAKRLDREGVKEKMGVYPERIRDLLAIMGDSSDNVPGIKGVGPKGAVKLLEEFDTVENLQERYAEIKNPKLKQKVEESLENLAMSLRLVTLERNVPMEIPWEAMTVGGYGTPEAVSLLDEYELRRIKTDLEKQWGKTSAEGKKQTKIAARATEEPESMEKEPSLPMAQGLPREGYQTVLDQNSFDAMLRELKKAKLFALDTETTALKAMEADLVGLSFALADGKAWYVPVGHVGLGVPAQLSQGVVVEALRPILEDEKIKKTGQNLKYDSLVLSNAGIELKGIAFDTMLASYLLDPDRREHNLDALARDHLNHTMIAYDDVVSKQMDSIADAAIEAVSTYASEDADAAYRLTEILRPRLEKEKKIAEFYNDIELPLLSVLVAMERAGFKIDVPFLNHYATELQKEIDALKIEIHELAGEEFNIDSPKQLGAILFEKLDLPVVKKKKTGPSTDVSVLTALSFQHDLPAKVLEYRKLSKLQGTYVTALPKLVNEKTLRVHTTFNQAVAVTGRLSSSDPNLQNIPIRSERGREIRRAFVAEDGNVLVVADYSQVELRILAHVTGDKNMIAAFKDGQDIHRRTAALVFDKKDKDVTSNERSKAKAVNFGISYGQTVHGLSQTLGISRAEAKTIIESYFDRFPGIKTWMETTIAQAKQDEFVTTLWGRKRFLPEINSKNAPLRSFNERSAINTPIQGTAADLIKAAMIRVHDRLSKDVPEAKLILQVHDELIVETPEGLADKVSKILVEEMEGAANWDVPIVADVGVGPNWLEAK